MKIAVVTGASSGIGREFVRQISCSFPELDEIWVIARRKEQLQSLCAGSRTAVRIIDGDLTKKAVFKKYREELAEHRPDIRLLVNAAGFGKSGTFEQIAGENRKLQTDMIDLNCRALTRMVQLSLPYIRKGGHIIQVASAAAFCPQPGFAVYAATKAYVLSFSRALGRELKHRGITVTSVCPGPVDTEFFKVSGELTDPLKKMTLADASAVVKKALRDSRKGRALSVYGPAMKAVHLAAKLLPHSLILKAEELFAK